MVHKSVATIIIGVYLTTYQNTNSIDEYNDQLNIITGLIHSFEEEGEVIIIGDFQTFPLNMYEDTDRCSTKRNSLSLHLANFLKSNEYQLLDVVSGTGPTYTYKHHSLPNSSYIDHIALPVN